MMTDNKNDKKRKKLTVSLGSDHDAWIALSKKYGVKPSTLAALVLKDLIEKDEKDADVKTQNITELVPVTGKVVLHQHLRLREDEVRLLDQYAMIMGLTRHQALVGLVRALVVDEPQFTIGEMEALNASNYDLRKLGVNVNQIAHHVNMLSKEKVSELNSKQLSELLKNLNEKSDYINSFIKTHTLKIWKLIKSSRDRTSLNSIRLRHGK
jgi:ribosomal protein S13